jgi:hypothetical protein
MSPSYPIPQKEYDKLDIDQQTLIMKLFELPDGINWNITIQISTLIKQN